MRTKHFFLFTLYFFLAAIALRAGAAVPLRFAADAESPRTYQASAYRGETLDIEARLLWRGAPLLVADGAEAAMCWQTNGMGDAWWTAPASVTTGGVVTATWSPSNDVGAAFYRVFLRVAGPGGTSYRANMLLRLLGSPGETPNTLPLPVKVLDFARITVTNAPWGEGGGTDGEAVTNIVNGIVADVLAGLPSSIYAWPGDWRLVVEDAGSTNASQGVSLAPRLDCYALVAAAEGIYRRYRVSAEPEPAIIGDGADMPPVSLAIHDPLGVVADFTDGVVSAAGIPGTALVAATDTNGVQRSAALVMTPVAPGARLSSMYAESPATEREIWNTNLFARLASISTNAADMVDYRWCRHQDNWRDKAPADGHRLIPRALSRWGTGGRVFESEWTWGGTGADAARFSPAVANDDFFWPELLPNLRCFSARVHETTASGNNSQCYPWIAIAPHYVLTAGHYSPAWWPGMRTVVQPCFQTASGSFATFFTDRLVGKVPRGDGVLADMMVVHVSSAIPSNCLARFAKDETLEQLSLTKFGRCAALMVSGHQTVHPLCLNLSQNGNVYSWDGEPGASALTVPYLADSGVCPNAMALEHSGHMFESGDPVFLANPAGKIVPVSIICTSNGRSFAGPRFGDVLESLSAMIRADSGGTEDIRYWSVEDLWIGGTNNLEAVR